MSCFMLHNFIRRNKEYEDEFDVLDDDDFELYDDDFDHDDVDYVEGGGNAAAAVAWRDDIATRMWNAYQLHLGIVPPAPAVP